MIAARPTIPRTEPPIWRSSDTGMSRARAVLPGRGDDGAGDQRAEADQLLGDAEAHRRDVAAGVFLGRRVAGDQLLQARAAGRDSSCRP